MTLPMSLIEAAPISATASSTIFLISSSFNCTLRKDTVQLIRSGILQIEKDNKIELDDEGVLDVISKQLKSRRDALPDFLKSGFTFSGGFGFLFALYAGLVIMLSFAYFAHDTVSGTGSFEPAKACRKT